MPKNLADELSKFKRIMIPELNSGQLKMIIDSTFDVRSVGFSKVKGKPFRVTELVARIEEEVQGLQS